MNTVDQRAWKGKAMEGWVARWYTRTRRKDMADFRGEAKRIRERLNRSSRVLEVAPGPGFFAIELSKLGGFPITGLDISQTLVNIAKKNAAAAGVQVDFRLGNASAMPLTDDSFDLHVNHEVYRSKVPESAMEEWLCVRSVSAVRNTY